MRRTHLLVNGLKLEVQQLLEVVHPVTRKLSVLPIVVEVYFVGVLDMPELVPGLGQVQVQLLVAVKKSFACLE